MSYSNSDISKPNAPSLTIPQSYPVALADFFHEAVKLLCGNLSLADSLDQFFHFLQRHIPLGTLILGRTLLDAQLLEVIAVCDGAGVNLYNRRIPFSTVQSAIVKNDFTPVMRKAESRLGIYVQGEAHPLTEYLNNCAEPVPFSVTPPYFFMRLLQANDHLGGATFTCTPGQTFEPIHLERLRMLRMPLFIALKNWAQFSELQELKEQIWLENLRLRRQLTGLSTVEVVGAKSGLRRVMDKVRLAGPVDVPVLITGETGTGKEVIARAVHELSARSQRPFVAVNCGGIPNTLIDSELFGHVKGSFTGATSNHQGRFERAHGGTIFLDEIAELPLDIQARLLRVLQEHSIERVGGNTAIPVDFRLLAATNRDLWDMVREGTFREDLYYRLRVVSIHLPPLRERRQDIPLLVDHMLRRAALRFGMLPPQLDKGEMNKLLDYAWPGNVRELQNTLEEALVLMPEGPLRFWVEAETRREKAAPAGAVPSGDLPSLHDCLQQYFRQLLSACGNKIGGPGGAAEKAGVNANTLRSKLDKLHIDYHRRNA